MHIDTLIIGAGASGLMLASLLDEKESVILIDANPRIGAKIAVSGGGRCNLSNAEISASHYRGDPSFIEPVLDRYDGGWLLRWMEERGLRVRKEKRSQYFCEEGAERLNELFRREIVLAKLLLGERVLSVSGEGPFIVETDRRNVHAHRVVVASGGLSFPRLGAGDIGYRIAESYGHRIVPPAPALVGLTLQKEQFFMKDLSGVSVPVIVRVEGREYADNLLFAHRGISGPAILNASLRWERGEIGVDFLPGFDLQSLRGAKSLSTLLPLPKRVAKAFLGHLGVEDRPADRLSGEERRRLEALRDYRFAPAGTFGFARAEVTRGGVDTAEVDPWTMESRRQKGLYFLGEVLDVTGELGGYNFQWAFSSAAVCADAITGRERG